MGARKPPLDCRDVKRALKLLGFEARKTKGTSHEHFVGIFRGKFRKVTVDCPKAPFSPDLIASMASQAGLKKGELYDAANGVTPKGWPN